MGMYDDIVVGDKAGQVKCWDSEMNTYRIGDKVPDIDTRITYSIAMREGGFANIEAGYLVGWTDKPRCAPVFDKYGGPFGPETAGLIGENYFWEKPGV